MIVEHRSRDGRGEPRTQGGEIERCRRVDAQIDEAGQGELVGAERGAEPGLDQALGGFAALFGMLTSCASGITVVNIDNGFGAAMAALSILGAIEANAGARGDRG